MSNISFSKHAGLAAAISGLLVLFAPVATANAKNHGGRASIITSSNGGGAKTSPVVRDHRGQPARTPPRRPICVGWFC